MKLSLLLSLIFLSLSTLAQKSLIGSAERLYLSNNYHHDQKLVVFVQGSKEVIERFADARSIVSKPAPKGYTRLTLTVGDLLDLADTPGIRYIDLSISQGMVLNDSTRVINNVEPIYNGDSGLLQPYTGEGILMGIIDGGIDFTHGDFLHQDSSTRVLMYWKQHDPFDAVLTPDYGYGRVYDSSLINAGSVGLGAQFIDHGCTVTGSAAGNANANGRHRGMAPHSDLIVVSSDFNIPNWKASVADAVDFIVRVADSLDRPVVINASLGDYLGSHDGLDPAALYIDSLLLAKSGRLMVAAAGNSGAQPPYHLGYTVDSDTSITWFEHNASTGLGVPGVFLEMWADTSDLQNVSFAISANNTANGFDRRGRTSFHNLTGNLNTLVSDTIWNAGNNLATVTYYMSQRDGQYLFQVVLDSPDSSQYDFGLLATGNGHFDLWSAAWLGMNDMVLSVADSNLYPELAHYKFPDTLMSIVDSWNCSEHVVSVANYYSRLSYTDFNGNPQTVGGTQNALSVSSSKGPNRLAQQKPNIAATGDMALSAGSMSLLLNAQTNSPHVLDQGGLHVRNGGTSMAAPIVAGIGALLLEKCPLISTSDFITALNLTARSDSFTGTLPNYGFGHGKVDGFELLLLTNFKPTINGNNEFCEGDSVEFTTTPSYTDYVWSTGDSGLSTYADTSGQMFVKAVNSIGCIGVSDSIQVTMHPLPPVPNISQIGNSLLSSPGYEYQWYLDGSAISTADNQQYIVLTSGYYQVEVINVHGCTNISDSLFVSKTGIEAHEPFVDLKPNPVADRLLIDVKNTHSVEYALYSSEGKCIIDGTIDDHVTLDLSGISAGLYILHISNSGVIHQHRVIKQ